MKNNITATTTVTIQATVSAVWNALTKPELIKQYFFGTDTITDWQEGSSILFRGEWQGRSYEDKGTILIIEPEKLLRYNYWSSMSGIEDKPENYLIVTYELFQEDGITTLTITQDNIPDEQTKIHSEQNWRKVVNDLKELLEEKLPAPEEDLRPG